MVSNRYPKVARVARHELLEQYLMTQRALCLCAWVRGRQRTGTRAYRYTSSALKALGQVQRRQWALIKPPLPGEVRVGPGEWATVGPGDSRKFHVTRPQGRKIIRRLIEEAAVAPAARYRLTGKISHKSFPTSRVTKKTP
jgi:hypothetical protein